MTASETSLKIVFMGTPDFALPALQSLIDSPHDVICVYTQPPRPKGRGHKVIPSPVDHLASTYQIEVRTPERLRKNAEEVRKFQKLEADIAIVAAYGLLLPREILFSPRYGCLNIHASLLPRWRGASPIQQAIWKGDAETGVTIMQMDTGLDTGDMLLKKSVPVTSETTAPALHDTLSEIGGELCLETVNTLAAGKSLKAEKQEDAQATYAPLLTREDGQIDWSEEAEKIQRQVRALNPWPGVWTSGGYDGEEISKHKILEAELVDEKVGLPPGSLASKTGLIACGMDTALKITKILPHGASKPMDVLAAINGGYISVNQSFEVR